MYFTVPVYETGKHQTYGEKSHKITTKEYSVPNTMYTLLCKEAGI